MEKTKQMFFRCWSWRDVTGNVLKVASTAPHQSAEKFSFFLLHRRLLLLLHFLPFFPLARSSLSRNRNRALWSRILTGWQLNFQNEKKFCFYPSLHWINKELEDRKIGWRRLQSIFNVHFGFVQLSSVKSGTPITLTTSAASFSTLFFSVI